MEPQKYHSLQCLAMNLCSPTQTWYTSVNFRGLMEDKHMITDILRLGLARKEDVVMWTLGTQGISSVFKYLSIKWSGSISLLM